MGVLDISVSGLLAAQRGLQITSHNVANVNTPGYNRQVLEVSSREPMFAGNGFIGTGVQVINIKRVHNEFLTSQIRSSVSAEAQANAFLQLASGVDNLFANSETGLGPALQDFFNAAQDVSNNPSSTTERQVMLSAGESLVSRLQFLDAKVSGLVSETRSKLNASINDINSLAIGLADINEKISNALGGANGQLPNDLMDQRDQLLLELSSHVAVTTVVQDDGAANVFIGNGQALVLGKNASQLDITETYSGRFDIIFSNNFSSSIVTDSISGGALSGILSFQDDMLIPAKNALGRIALGIADSFNAQHELGLNLNNNSNVSFFTVPSPDVIALGGSLNNINASIVDVNQLTDSNYELVYTAADTYTLTRLSDGQTTVINTGGTYPHTSTSIDGFTLDIAAAAGAVGDQYIIRPTVNGASDISLAINDPNAIAAANPLRAVVATSAGGTPSNTGNADISSIEISSVTGVPLASAITLTFDNVLNQFNLSAPPGGTLAYNPATESSGKQFVIPSAGNVQFTISGVPDNGDQFIIENNTNAEGDNSNMLLLSALQNSKTLLNSTSSYQEAYGQMVSTVGTSTRQTEISSQALGALVEQSVEAKESLSGVNLDEEAANMLEFQQIYLAASQLISTANTIFQSLLNSVA